MRSPHWLLAGYWYLGLRTSLWVACYARCQPGSFEVGSLWPGLGPGRKLELPLGLIFWYHRFMKKATKRDTKKSRGRPSTGIGIQIGTRWPADIVRLVDEWRREHPDLPGRPEAIRRLVELGLKAKK
jgi:hypothetical protein